MNINFAVSNLMYQNSIKYQKVESSWYQNFPLVYKMFFFCTKNNFNFWLKDCFPVNKINFNQLVLYLPMKEIRSFFANVGVELAKLA